MPSDLERFIEDRVADRDYTCIDADIWSSDYPNDPLPVLMMINGGITMVWVPTASVASAAGEKTALLVEFRAFVDGAEIAVPGTATEFHISRSAEAI